MKTRESLRGFTLVELLLVIATIALLAALLFPVLSSARKQARMSRCTANLRQIGTALSLYAADYGEYPDPMRLTRSIQDERILFCPEDSGGTAASSYTFRTVLPPHFRPYWEEVELDPNTVLVVCNNHLEEPEGHVGRTLTHGPPRYPFKLALRAGGAVERLHVSRIREVLVPGPRPAYVRVYPGELSYEQVMR
jgi:prepilin-type N-terminal cleavage/methylation domain-containing protein